MQLQTEICSKSNDPKKETVIDYNVGFDPKIWVQWLELFNLKPSNPVLEAVNDINSNNNILTKHPRLKQSKVS